MKPWLRLTLTLIGLALLCLFLSMSQPAGLIDQVAGSKPGLASRREPAPGPLPATLDLNMKFDPARARPLPHLVRDYVWTKYDLGPPGLLAQKPPELNRTLASSRSGLAAHNELSSHFFLEITAPIPSNLKIGAFATAFSYFPSQK